jgi:hypothetical protein
LLHHLDLAASNLGGAASQLPCLQMHLVTTVEVEVAILMFQLTPVHELVVLDLLVHLSSEHFQMKELVPS